MCEFDIENKEKFWKFYEDEILPFFMNEELERVKKVQGNFVHIVFYIGILGLLCYTFFLQNVYLGVLSLFLFVIIEYFILRRDAKIYSDYLKNKFLFKFLEPIKYFVKQNDEMYVLRNNPNIVKREIKVTINKKNINIPYASEFVKKYWERSGLFERIDFVKKEDVYSGKYKGINFNFGDVTLSNNISSAFVPFFKGLVVCFDLNKNIQSQTIINKKEFFINNGVLKVSYLVSLWHCLFLFLLLLTILIPCILFYGLAKSAIIFAFVLVLAYVVIKDYFLHNWRKNKKLQAMRLEDLKFNNMYASYSTDQVEGRYAITPAFMERLLNLKLAFKAKNISASFYDDKLMIAIETKKDLFEIGNLWHPLTDRKYAENFYNEMSSILRMIEYFKLDEKTGL